ncbi:MAG TPA: DNA-processing protein DprA, partial [Ktedonobacteraceae bacterium]|nr:DNA-processing protein DprA [Ktedonobacteraceae bacterium]
MPATLLDDNTIYVFALGLLKGVGPQNHRALVSRFPLCQEFETASIQVLEKVLRSALASSVYAQVHSSAWDGLLAQAKTTLQRHLKLGIMPIPITSPAYSPLLEQIPDPPVMLYAKGNISLLQHLNSVAIVGTREPTPKGTTVARHLAHYLAQQQYCIVSGLAKGVDTAAHEGALEVQGKTIAVYATPLDTVYPAENRGLAKRILDAGGLVISEIPLGQKSFRSAFVLRDRMQSGLSLSVIPVQTSIDGGTMHTVKFAKAQSRLVACPVPLKDEAHLKQYEGIFSIMREANAQTYAFRAGKVEESEILTRMQMIRWHLLSYVEQKEINYAKATEAQASDTVPQEAHTHEQSASAASSAVAIPSETVNSQQYEREAEKLFHDVKRQETNAPTETSLKEPNVEPELPTA